MSPIPVGVAISTERWPASRSSEFLQSRKPSIWGSPRTSNPSSYTQPAPFYRERSPVTSAELVVPCMVARVSSARIRTSKPTPQVPAPLAGTIELPAFAPFAMWIPIGRDDASIPHLLGRSSIAPPRRTQLRKDSQRIHRRGASSCRRWHTVCSGEPPERGVGKLCSASEWRNAATNSSKPAKTTTPPVVADATTGTIVPKPPDCHRGSTPVADDCGCSLYASQHPASHTSRNKDDDYDDVFGPGQQNQSMGRWVLSLEQARTFRRP